MKSLLACRLANQVMSSVRAPVRAVSANALAFERNPRQLLCRIILLLFLALAVSTSVASRAAAAPTAPTFTVNSTKDEPDAAIGDGNCVSTPSGFCTLRAAINEANHYPSGGVTIIIPIGTYQLTIAPSGIFNDEVTGSLKVLAAMTIQGASAATTIIEQTQNDSVIKEDSGTAQANIEHVTIRKGNPGSTPGGGVFNNGKLFMLDVSISNNSASYGGGIYNSGTATIWQSDISNNIASLGGGGIYDVATLNLDNSTISDNSTPAYGGGIEMQSSANAIADIQFTTIAGNLADSNSTASGSGGGLFIPSAATVTAHGLLLAQNYTAFNPHDCAGTITSTDYNLVEVTPGCTLTGSTANSLTGVASWLDSPKNNGGETFTRALFATSPAIGIIPAAQCTSAFGSDQRGVPRGIGSNCSIGAFEGSVPVSLYNTNLIFNNDAEGSAGSPNGAVVGMPYWLNPTSPFSRATNVPYDALGGFPTSLNPGPTNRGFNFFAGGLNQDGGYGQQRDVSAIGSAIDSGGVRYDLSGYFGGFANQNDLSILYANFYTGSATLISAAQIGNVQAADRGNQTGLLFRSTSGFVPKGTRIILISLNMYNAGSPGSYNDGYSDNVSLILNPSLLYLPLILR